VKTGRLLSPPHARRRLVLGAYRPAARAPERETPGKKVVGAGTPVVGGVSATDERLRSAPRTEAAAAPRPGRRKPSARAQGAPAETATADPDR